MKSERRTAGKRRRQVKGKQQPCLKEKKIQPKVLIFLKESALLFLIIAGCLFFFLKFGVHQVDGRSMFPTFQSGDRILIRRTQQPKRYEIITFTPAGKKNESYIKRVLGVPGDTIVVNGTFLFLLSGEDEQMAVDDSSALPDGTMKINISETVASELKGYSKIPENCYFVEGDNRNNSTDSRALGLIMSNQIEGVVNWRYFPFNKIGGVR